MFSSGIWEIINSLIQRVCGLDLVHELMDTKLFSVLKISRILLRECLSCVPRDVFASCKVWLEVVETTLGTNP